jgi:hypothetical protein
LSSSINQPQPQQQQEEGGEHDQLSMTGSILTSREKPCMYIDTSISSNSDARLDTDGDNQSHSRYYSPIRQSRIIDHHHHHNNNITDHDNNNGNNSIICSPIQSAIRMRMAKEDESSSRKVKNQGDVYHLVSPIMTTTNNKNKYAWNQHQHQHQHQHQACQQSNIWKILFKRFQKGFKMICQLLGMICLICTIIIIWMIRNDDHYQSKGDYNIIHHLHNILSFLEGGGVRIYLKKVVASFIMNYILNVTDIAEVVNDFPQYMYPHNDNVEVGGSGDGRSLDNIGGICVNFRNEEEFMSYFS